MKRIALATVLALATTQAFAGDGGIIRKQSAAGVTATADALQQNLETAGLTIFARVDHGAGAQIVGEDIGASELLIFGNPKVGTPAMKDDPLAGLFLPLKVLIYEDTGGQAWIAYEDPAESLAKLGGIGTDAAYLNIMQGALAKFTGALAQ